MHDGLVNAMTCPCTQEIFYRPTSVPCGHAFEEEFIKTLIANEPHGAKCPVCRTPITENDLRREYAFEAAIECFLMENPTYRNEQYFPEKTIATLFIEKKFSEILDILGRHPNSINSLVAQQKSIFTIAILNKKNHFVGQLLKRFREQLNLNATLEIGDKITTPVLLAAGLLDAATFSLFLEDGIQSTYAACNTTPLLEAIIHRNHANIALLLDYTADLEVNALHGVNGGALHYAITHCTLDEFQKLLSVPGLNLNLKNGKGQTALNIAFDNNALVKASRLLANPLFNFTTLSEENILRFVEHSTLDQWHLFIKNLQAQQYRFTENILIKMFHKILERDSYDMLSSFLLFPGNQHFLFRQMPLVLRYLYSEHQKDSKIYNFLLGMYLFHALINDLTIDRRISLDCVCGLLDDDVLELKNSFPNVDQQKARFLEHFLLALKNGQHIAPDYKEVFDFQIRALNKIFLFAHQNYFRHKDNWEKKIRELALSFFMSLPNGKKNNDWLRLVKEEPIIKTPRFFLTFHDTKSFTTMERELASRETLRP